MTLERIRGLRPHAAMVLALATTVGCSDSGVLTPEVAGPSFAMAGAESQPADVIENFGLIQGAELHDAWLTRNARSIHVRMKATVPAPNTATVWAAIFNAPEGCWHTPCTLEDLLENPDAEPSLLRAGGRVLGGSNVNITGRVREGDLSNVMFGPGLGDARTAEVHFIIRAHGPALPTQVDDQIHTFDGGCGENECLDVGAAIFLTPVG